MGFVFAFLRAASVRLSIGKVFSFAFAVIVTACVPPFAAEAQTADPTIQQRLDNVTIPLDYNQGFTAQDNTAPEIKTCAQMPTEDQNHCHNVVDLLKRCFVHDTAKTVNTQDMLHESFEKSGAICTKKIWGDLQGELRALSHYEAIIITVTVDRTPTSLTSERMSLMQNRFCSNFKVEEENRACQYVYKTYNSEACRDAKKSHSSEPPSLDVINKVIEQCVKTTTEEEKQKTLTEAKKFRTAAEKLPADQKNKLFKRAAGAIEVNKPSFAFALKKYNLSKQPTVIKITGTAKQGYDTNASHSHLTPTVDWSSNLGGMAQVTTGVSTDRPYDVLGASIQTTSLRYHRLTTLNNDALITQAGYQVLLNAYFYDKDNRYVPINTGKLTKDAITPNDVITWQALIFAVTNQASYTPFFTQQTTDLTTPQIQYSIMNIPLSGYDFDSLCISPKPAPLWTEPKKPEPHKTEPEAPSRGFCVSLNLSANAGRTLSATTDTLQNYNFSLTATPSVHFSNSNLSLSFPTSLTERIFDAVQGGRKDITWQTGANLAYKLDIASLNAGQISSTFTLPVTLTQNYSNIVKNRYDDVTVMPTLTFTFQSLPLEVITAKK